MDLIKYIELKECILFEIDLICIVFKKPIFNEADSFIFEVDSQKAFFAATFEELWFFEVKSFYKIISLKYQNE